MVSYGLLTGGLTVWFAVCLCRCEVSEDGYNTLANRLKALVGSKKSGISTNSKDDTSESSPNLPARGYSCNEQDTTAEETLGDSWESMLATGFKDLRLIHDDCQKRIKERLRRKSDGAEDELSKIREKVISLYKCMKVISFRHIDDFLSEDVIPISRYLEFVRDGRNETKSRMSRTGTGGHPYAADILSRNWLDLITERIGRVLQDHSLKFRLGDNVTEGRGRRRDHRMFAMMMMGFVIMASILVPMGFQFLTVLGGKSLLMAKMALIMSAINGLKKIATSNVGYGLYHAGPETFHHDPHHHGYHEKIFHIKAQEQPESPFDVVI